MAYQALYRQWRPETFADMVGQEAIVTTLRRQIATRRISHAYLFCGSRGTGKTSTAKILSRAVNCLDPQEGNPCGECESCRRLLRDESVDVQEIDAASNNGVDEVRNLRENVKYPPQQNSFKVYIIDEVHMLSPAAFNALLKTLEEPPEYVVFILATTAPEKLPATILSRCQRYDFGRIPAQKIAGRLRQAAEGAGAQATEEALMTIAVAAEGGMRDALSILDMCISRGGELNVEVVQQVLGTTDKSFLFAFTDSLIRQDAGTVLGQIDTLIRSGRDPSVFAREMTRHLRALVLAKNCGSALKNLLDITEENAARYAAQADQLTITRLMRMLDLFNGVESEMRWSVTPQICLESTALKACLRTAETDPQALMDRITELEGQLESLTSKLTSGEIAAPSASTRPAPRTKPKPAPVPVNEGWKKALEMLKQEPETLSMLSRGTLISFEDGHYILQTEPIFQEILSREAVVKHVAECLTEVTGQACTFRAVTEPPSDMRPQSPEQESLISQLRHTFGGENVIETDKSPG